MTSLPKTMAKSGLPETKQLIYHSKDIHKSYPKMYFLLNLGYRVKVMGIFVKFRLFLVCPLTKYGYLT